jgi:hypothetical protein
VASSPDRSLLSAITDREQLIYLLSEASELEHGLCCCYLFAAFSLKRNLDEGLTASEHEALVRWNRVISGVAVQEMLHLALASNPCQRSWAGICRPLRQKSNRAGLLGRRRLASDRGQGASLPAAVVEVVWTQPGLERRAA